jgi:hypothetical protein
MGDLVTVDALKAQPEAGAYRIECLSRRRNDDPQRGKMLQELPMFHVLLL